MDCLMIAVVVSAFLTGAAAASVGWWWVVYRLVCMVWDVEGLTLSLSATARALRDEGRGTGAELDATLTAAEGRVDASKAA